MPRPKAFHPKRAKRPTKRLIAPHGNKIEYKGIQFDSETEFRYYLDLEKDKSVLRIDLHPKFNIIPAYGVKCKKCDGRGVIHNLKTNNPNKCKRCKLGTVIKPGAVYTADFWVHYIDGFEEVIDVKGFKAGRDFSLRKKLFEMQNGMELVVVRWDREKMSWKRE